MYPIISCTTERQRKQMLAFSFRPPIVKERCHKMKQCRAIRATEYKFTNKAEITTNNIAMVPMYAPQNTANLK